MQQIQEWRGAGRDMQHIWEWSRVQARFGQEYLKEIDY